MVYNNVNGFPVILADDRNPYTSWKHHRQRGSLGGVDMVASYGTPVKAPSSGVVRLSSNTGSGGRYVTIHAADGHQDELMHLSAFKVHDGQHVTRGQIVGLSGASGFGSNHYYAPHLHWHRIQPNGVRVIPWSYFTKTAAKVTKPPRIAYTIQTGKRNATFNKRFQWYAHLNGYGGKLTGTMSRASWKGVQKGLRNYGYKGPLDGDPGPNTIKALHRMARKYGSKDPVQGKTTPNMWRGVARRLNKL